MAKKVEIKKSWRGGFFFRNVNKLVYTMAHGNFEYAFFKLGCGKVAIMKVGMTRDEVAIMERSTAVRQRKSLLKRGAKVTNTKRFAEDYQNFYLEKRMDWYTDSLP